MDNPILKLEKIEKSFDGNAVLMGIDLSVRQGEFITLLGSSGCGKTTTLRIIAGLEHPDKGEVFLDGVNITNMVPEKRDVSMVFQNYALFPHMTAAQNIGYGLKLKKYKKREIDAEVKKVLELVQLEGMEKRMPGELSGGQKQRVAIARAVVNQPRILLLDEPLGALDLQLRRQMQVELKKLQKHLGITFIYITHDQEEALNMSDRIVVMKEGKFEQIGTPREIYEEPKTSFTAQFVGNANIIKGIVAAQKQGKAEVDIENVRFTVPTGKKTLRTGESVALAVRSEHLVLDSYKSDKPGIPGVVTEKQFVGGMLRITVKLSNGLEAVASRHGMDMDFAEGEQVKVSWLYPHGIPVESEVEL